MMLTHDELLSVVQLTLSFLPVDSCALSWFTFQLFLKTLPAQEQKFQHQGENMRVEHLEETKSGGSCVSSSSSSASSHSSS
eukprot:1818753-Ditylum_brightwellii.AAC.1